MSHSSTQSGTRNTTLFPKPLKVVELGESVATATCGRFLMKLGGEITRVLPAGSHASLDDLGPEIGEGAEARSSVAEWLRHGKTMTTLDLASTEGRAALDALVAEADVILISGTSAEWEALAVRIDDIQALAPTAVIGQITDWGDSGPHVNQAGGELQLQAMGGLMNLVGVLEREPVRLGGYPMQATTGLLALDGVMIGLFARENTGKGSRFSTSSFESVVHVEWKIASFAQDGRRKEIRGEDGGGPVVVRCTDGHLALFFVPKNWADVKTLIGDPRLNDEEFATSAGRAKGQARLTSLVEETTRSLSKKDLYYRAQSLGIPTGHVATMSDLLASPQYRARNFFESVDIAGLGRGELPDAPWQVIRAGQFKARGDAA